MAINVDLLPAYVGLKRWFKRLLAICLLLVAGVAGILFALYYKNQQLLKKYTEDAEAIETYATKTEAAQRATQQAKADAEPMQTAINFMSDSSKTGPERAALFDLIRAYIYYQPRGGAIVQAMDLSDGQNLKLNATVRTPNDYAQFLIKLRQGSADKGGPLFDGLPTAGGVPGFPPPRATIGTQAQAGQNGQRTSSGPGTPINPNEPTILIMPLNIPAQGKLKHPITLPPDPVGGGPAAGAAGGGSSSSYPGSQGG